MILFLQFKHRLQHRLLLLLLGVLIIGSAQSVSAQSAPLTGVVVDSEKAPIIGATIIVEGSNIGTTTSMTGKFSIGAKPGDVILVSFIGYKNQKVTVTTKTNITISMVSSTTELDEVVVVGYGEQTKANLLGAVATVKASDIEATTSSDIVNSITGRAPGVRVAQYSSEPGTFDTDIDIRGMGTPLFIIDGAERSQEEFSRLSSFEIESVSILKDASAAIYGVKAANGVVLVTTKKGAKQKTKVSYTGRFGIQAVTEYLDLCSALKYGEMYNEKTINAKIRSRTYFQYEDELWSSLEYDTDYFNKCLSGEIQSYDYIDMIMNDIATQQQHAISLNGGNDNTTYFMSFGYYNEQGLYSSGSLNSDKYNARINVTTTVAKGLTFNANVGYINTIRNAPSSSLYDIFKNAICTPVNDSPYANNNSDYLAMSEWNLESPIAMADSDISGYTLTDQKYLQSTFALNYRAPRLKDVLFRAQLNYDYNNKKNEVFDKEYELYEYDEEYDYYKTFTYNSPSALTQTLQDQTRLTYQVSANYNKKSKNKEHTFGALLLAEARDVVTESTTSSSELYVDEHPNLSAGMSESNSVTSSLSHTAKMSLVTRLSYNYKSKYLLETTARLDGSSKFAPENRWGVFPSVLAAWRFSEENFVRNLFPRLSNGKLRVSYGIMGDDASADSQYEAGYYYPTSSTTQTGAQFGDTWTPGLEVSDVENEDLTWYTSRTFNVGIDLGILDSKIYTEIDYFERRREGLLTSTTNSTPDYVGANLPQENLNGDLTRGFEIVVGHRNKIGKVKYDISANVSYTRTKWTYYEESDQATSYDTWRNSLSGRYTDVVWGYQTDGVYRTFEEIALAPIMDGNGNKTILPGTYKYIDQNNDGVINSNDIVPIGKGGLKPLMYYGLNLNIDYQGWDFGMLWQGAAKNLVRYTATTLSTPFGFGYATPLEEMTDRWHCINYNDPYNSASWVEGKYPAVGTATTIDGGYADQQFFEATYLRLKSVELGYTFTGETLKKMRLSKCRVYLSGYNLLTFYAGHSFVDPEFNSGRTYSYPVTFNTNVGVDLTF